MITLSRLYVHPVKSLRGLQLSYAGSAAAVWPSTATYDHRAGWHLYYRAPIPADGAVHAGAAAGRAIPDRAGRRAAIRFSDFAAAPQPTEVWGNHFTALIAPDEINRWLSGYFQRDVQLRWLGPELTRRVKKHPDPLTFADGYPYLLINRGFFQRSAAALPRQHQAGTVPLTRW